MRRLTLAVIVVLLFGAGVVSGSQEEEIRKELEGYLLAPEEIGEGWVIQAIGKMEPQPTGAITIAAIYLKDDLTLFSTILLFEDQKGATDFFAETKKALEDQGPIDVELGDEAFISALENDRQLVFRVGRLVFILRTAADLDMISLAKIQIEKLKQEGG